MQKFIAIGNLTKDIEVRPVGQSQCGVVGLAVSERYRKSDNTIEEKVEFFNLEIWDKPNFYPYLVKGAQLYIEGVIRTDKYTGQDGVARETKKIRVQSIQLLSRPQQQQQQAPAAPQYQAPAPPAAPAYQRPASVPPVPPVPPAPAAPTYQAPPAPQQGSADDLPF